MKTKEPAFPPPRKRFGQHFLHDTMVLQNILTLIHPQKTDHIIEIGPGRGALTDYLVGCDVHRLDLIEIDRDLVSYLREKYKTYPSVTVHSGDVLTFDLKAIITDRLARVVGNLPYNISTPLLFKLFDSIPYIQDLHFMLQKEVVLRLTAPVGSQNYNRLSVMTHYFCDNSQLLAVPATAFTPPPRVESALVRLTPHRSLQLQAKDPSLFSLLVKEAFTQRRKKISNALERLVTLPQLQAVGISPSWRPQNLSVAHFVDLSNILSQEKEKSESP